MLSAAHILAMDAKNLFDVVDSIRNRYQHILNSQLACKLQSSGAPSSSSLSDVDSANEVCDVDLYDNEVLKTQHMQISSSDEGSTREILKTKTHKSHDSMGKTNEPLKIIEESFNNSEEHMYCNTSALNSQA